VVVAQTGNCTAETGTTTAWEVIASSTNHTKITYTFHAAGVAGISDVTRRSRVATGTILTDFADSQCESVDVSRDADELSAARAAVFQNELAQMVQPAYPQNCLTVYPLPSNSGASSIAERCRLATFHQFLIRDVWPGDALIVHDNFYDVFDWLSANNAQGGAAFNVGERQTWLNLTGTQWTQQVSLRMSNIDAIHFGLVEDNVNTQWKEPPLE